MKAFNTNKFTTIFLIFAVIIIWGIILYRIIDYFFKDEKVEFEIVDNVNHSIYRTINPEIQDSTKITYVKLERDPFTFTVHKKNKNKQPVREEREKVISTKEKIDYSIKGVIINKNSKSLILNDITNGQTFFLQEGDKYKYIKIKKITSNTVTLLEYKKIKIIKINN